MSAHQLSAAQRRARLGRSGLHVPPVLVITITNRCNLQCAGCYARALRPESEIALTPNRLQAILAEAAELGVGLVFLAGGEPLLRPDLLDVTRSCRSITFPIFTNGLLLDQGWTERFRRQRNLIPVVSLDGGEAQTDRRRGMGTYDRLHGAIAHLAKRGVFVGTSLTVTSENAPTLTGEEFVRSLIGVGCQLFFFVEFVPITPGSERLVLSAQQRAALVQALDRFRARLPGLFVGFPGDEAQYGGCLAAGRGFLHVNAAGRLEPCPFAPFSDRSLSEVSLREALSSPLLDAIRRHHDRLSENTGGCALWANREWVRSLTGDA